MKAEIDITKTAQDLETRANQILTDARALLLGKTAEVVSNYNGQPLGCYGPSLKGQQFTILGVSLGR